MRQILLVSVGVVVSIGIAQAACIQAPSCSSLGYESSTACEGGLKCPFGEYWNCTLVNKIAELENRSGNTKDCIIGSIFYSDYTCSYGSLTTGKTPIGVVVYSNGQGQGQAISLESVGTYKWSTSTADISLLPDTGYSNVSGRLNNIASDIKSCVNTNYIMIEGDSSTYPAAWATKEYSTVGTKAGDWCLPAAGILVSIYDELSTINDAITLAGGTEMGTSYTMWSSSEEYVYSVSTKTRSAIYSDFSSSGGSKTAGVSSKTKTTSYQVRPVLMF